jgi:hypothetical protein
VFGFWLLELLEDLLPPASARRILPSEADELCCVLVEFEEDDAVDDGEFCVPVELDGAVACGVADVEDELEGAAPDAPPAD